MTMVANNANVYKKISSHPVLIYTAILAVASGKKATVQKRRKETSTNISLETSNSLQWADLR